MTSAYFQFFEDLKHNNNRDWFIANKDRYERDAKEPFMELLKKLVDALAPNEPELALVPIKQMLFRINRDTRFSKDKIPYKEHLSASVGRYGTKDKIYPGHYIQISNENAFIAGGAYFFEQKETLLRVRQFIAAYPERFSALITAPDFVKYWGEIRGEKNKRIPPEFTEDHKNQPLIANTQFYWHQNVSQTDILSSDFVENLKNHFTAALPLNNFLVEAIYG